MTNNPEMSVKMSMKARTSVGRSAAPALPTHLAHRADGWQAAVETGCGQLRLVVDALRLVMGSASLAVQQVVERVGLVVSLGVGLSRQLSAGKSQPEPFAQRVWQVSNVATMLDRLAIGPGMRVRMAGRWRLI